MPIPFSKGIDEGSPFRHGLRWWQSLIVEESDFFDGEPPLLYQMLSMGVRQRQAHVEIPIDAIERLGVRTSGGFFLRREDGRGITALVSLLEGVNPAFPTACGTVRFHAHTDDCGPPG